MDKETEELMVYRQLMSSQKYQEMCGKSTGNEIGRLAQGLPGRVEGINSIFFNLKDKVP